MCGHCQFVRGTIEKMIDILIHTYVDNTEAEFLLLTKEEQQAALEEKLP